MKTNTIHALETTGNVIGNVVFAVTSTAYNLVLAAPHILALAIYEGAMCGKDNFNNYHKKFNSKSNISGFVKSFKDQGFKNIISIPLSITGAAIQGAFGVLKGLANGVSQVIDYEKAIFNNFVNRTFNTGVDVKLPKRLVFNPHYDSRFDGVTSGISAFRGEKYKLVEGSEDMKNNWLNRLVGLDINYPAEARWGDIYTYRGKYLDLKKSVSDSKER